MYDLNKLQKALGYRFTNLSLLKLALTHKSYSRNSNERLEFVGDGILDYIIAQCLYKRYPHFAEGDLSKIRAVLVNQDTLFEVALTIGLEECLLLGRGEEKSGGREKPSILADCFEALLAAITFDSSYIQITEVIERLFDKYLANAEHLITKDYKSVLQELLQSHKLKLPDYKLLEIKEHGAELHVECLIPELDIKIFAKGKNKKEASQSAAELALAQVRSLLK